MIPEIRAIRHPRVKEVVFVDGDIPRIELSDIYTNVRIGVDIETTGLNKTLDKILTIQLFLPLQRRVIVLRNFDPYPNNFIQVMRSFSITKIFHHAGFDVNFIMRDWPHLPQKIACTKIAAKVTDIQKVYSHSLKNLLDRFFDIKLDKDQNIIMSDWSRSKLTVTQMQYLVNDVAYLPELLDVLTDQATKQKLKTELIATFDYLPHHIKLAIIGDVSTLFGY